MGICTRMRDVMASNVNAMLDRAEDPEKLLRQLIREMEDILIRTKAECASAMAEAARYGREAGDARTRATDWEAKARIAVEKGREELAREALLEKRRCVELAESLEKRQAELGAVVDQYRADIVELEARMGNVLERKRVLVQRHAGARARKCAQMTMRRVDCADVMDKVEALQRRTEQAEAEANVAGFGGKPSLEAEFDRLIGDEDLEKELEQIRTEVGVDKQT